MNKWPDIEAAVNEGLDEAFAKAALIKWRSIVNEPPPVGEYIWCWHPVWRHAFPAQYAGDEFGKVFVDTCEAAAKGRWDYATHWMPMLRPSEAERKL